MRYLPAVLNAPDWGPMLVSEAKGRPLGEAPPTF